MIVPVNKNEHEPWQVMAAREVYSATPWISVVKQQVRLPDGRVIDDYHQIELPDCIIVFAETEDNRVVVERSYRHGPGAVILALPAGLIDRNEDPLDAARRELLEETGYASEEWQALGRYVVHGNYGCGHAHLFHARQARLITKPNPDDLEDMEVVLMQLSALIDAISTGEVCTMGTMATIALATNPLVQYRAEPNLASLNP